MSEKIATKNKLANIDTISSSEKIKIGLAMLAVVLIGVIIFAMLFALLRYNKKQVAEGGTPYGGRPSVSNPEE